MPSPSDSDMFSAATAAPTGALRAAVSGHVDPAGSAPWALQVVVRVERGEARPTHSAVCAAVASATVWFLDGDRDGHGGVWGPGVSRWLEGRIRKHVRRARGAAFERLGEVPSMLVTRNGVQVRIFQPCPTDEVPKVVSRCRLGGFELTDTVDALIGAADRDPLGAVPVVSLSADPVLSTGKAAAAAAHAAQLAYMAMGEQRRDLWREAGFAVALELPGVERWSERVASAPVVVRDAGFTEVDPSTVTATAIWV